MSSDELALLLRATNRLNSSWQLHDILDKLYEDLQALVTEKGIDAENERVRLVSLRVVSETGETPNAAVTLSIDGEEKSGSAEGGGPVDAAYKAIEAIVQSGASLQLYSVNNITSGTDSQGDVTVRFEKGGRIINGQGADTDIVIASAKAYINGVNRLLVPEVREHPQAADV